MSLVYYPKSHRYKLDGSWVQGVTTILKQGLPNSSLMYWSARTVAEFVADNDAQVEQLRGMGRNSLVAALKEVPWTARDAAAARGTDVHALAERLVAGDEVDVPEHLAGYVDGCVQFLNDWQPEAIFTERPSAHRAHRWAGTPDLVGRLPDGRVCLIDWKTSKAVYESHAYQQCAYAHAEFYNDEDGNEQPFPKIDIGLVVLLRQHDYQVHPVDITDDAYTDFRYIHAVSRAGKADRVGPPMTAPGQDAA